MTIVITGKENIVRFRMNNKDAEALQLGASIKRTIFVPVQAYTHSNGLKWKRSAHSVHYLNQEGLEIGYYLLDFPSMNILVFDSPRHWSTEVLDSSFYEDESLI